MKTLLRFVVLLGFVLMIGCADADIPFVTVLCFEFCGMALSLAGYSALCHYRRYLRRRRICGKISCRRNALNWQRVRNTVKRRKISAVKS